MSHYHRQDGQGFQVYADGGNVYDGKTENSQNLLFRNKDKMANYTPSIFYDQYSKPQNYDADYFLNLGKKYSQEYIEPYAKVAQSMPVYQTKKTKTPIDLSGLDRYAPVAANIGLGISDIFSKPEITKYGRYTPEKLISHMDYTPFDTEWMINKLKSQTAATRSGILNTASGNRATAMAGLLGVNQQTNEAIGDAYMRAAQYNQDRKNQTLQFNSAIEQANVGAANQAQLQNLQLQQQEIQSNAMARAAQRNAARQAILNAAGNIGDIGRENWAAKTGSQMFGYEIDPITGKIKYKK